MISKCLVSNSVNVGNCHPLEVVCRGSETQLQVGENLVIEFSALRLNNILSTIYYIHVQFSIKIFVKTFQFCYLFSS